MALNFTGANHERLISEINITPLTDVMLVLLVIFMVTTPLIMAESIKVRLAAAGPSAAPRGEGPAATVSISADGRYAVNGAAVPLNGLQDRLREEFGRTGSSSVIIKADMDARHSSVVLALDRARGAGASKLAISTLRKADAGGKEKR